MEIRVWKIKVKRGTHRRMGEKCMSIGLIQKTPVRGNCKEF